MQTNTRTIGLEVEKKARDYLEDQGQMYRYAREKVRPSCPLTFARMAAIRYLCLASPCLIS